MSTKKQSQQKKKGKEPKPPLPIGARVIAFSQATAFAGTAEYLATRIGTPPDAGIVAAYLVNAGFAVELYFKLFMIAARAGHMSEGHSLPVLLTEFPPFLRSEFNKVYDTHPNAKTGAVRLVAITIGEKPAPNEQHEGRYGTFDEAISSIANIFVDARYFFENVRGHDYAIMAYPTDAISAIFDALEKTYRRFEAGEFSGVDTGQ